MDLKSKGIVSWFGNTGCVWQAGPWYCWEHNPAYRSAAAAVSCVCTVTLLSGHPTSKATLLMEEKVLNMEDLCLNPYNPVPDSHSCMSELWVSLRVAAQALSPVLLKLTGGLSLTVETRSDPERWTKASNTLAPGEAFMPSAIKCVLCWAALLKMHEPSGSLFRGRCVCCPGLGAAAPALKVSLCSFASPMVKISWTQSISEVRPAKYSYLVRWCKDLLGVEGVDAGCSWAALWGAGPGNQQRVVTLRRGAGPEWKHQSHGSGWRETPHE